VTCSKSISTSESRSTTRRASSTPSSTVAATVPWSSKARMVRSGSVFTVWGPMSGSTYRMSLYSGSLVLVLAQSIRCTWAPASSSRSHLSPLKSSWKRR